LRQEEFQEKTNVWDTLRINRSGQAENAEVAEKRREEKRREEKRREAFDRKSPPFAKDAKSGAPSRSLVGWR
jgi:hypothetical protein